MIEIDHAALNDSEPPTPEPAQPILASQLLRLEKKLRKRFVEQGRLERISTGCGEIDEILGGGCERGVVVGISSEGGEGRRLSLHLLASILLSNLTLPPQSFIRSKATVVDTTGSFPVSLLARILKSRLLSSCATSAIKAVQTANYATVGQQSATTDEEVDADVQRCLEMVAISRVFDIEGLWEVLSEVGRDSAAQADFETRSPSLNPTSNEKRPRKPTEIIDSEEELTPEEGIPISLTNEGASTSGIEIIIIDNLTHIITELLSRKEKSEAHGLLTLLSLTLHTMTHTSNILTIVHNGTSSSISSSASHTYPTTTSFGNHPRNPRQPQIPNPSSIFPSNPAKPALGQIFTQFPELHLFISKLPKRREDVEMRYGGDESLPGPENRIEYCFVVEVLKDETPNLGSESRRGKAKEVDDGKEKGKRFGWREQRWTAVDVTADGTGLVGAFQVKGNMRGMGLDRERIGGLKDVGYIAKIYGFGGRRV